MRTLTMSALAVVAGLVATSTAQAQDYPWCANYGSTHGGKNCGFVSYLQCMAALSGNGGYCQENPFFRTTGPAAPDDGRRHRRRHPHD